MSLLLSATHCFMFTFAIYVAPVPHHFAEHLCCGRRAGRTMSVPCNALYWNYSQRVGISSCNVVASLPLLELTLPWRDRANGNFTTIHLDQLAYTLTKRRNSTLNVSPSSFSNSRAARGLLHHKPPPQTLYPKLCRDKHDSCIFVSV